MVELGSGIKRLLISGQQATTQSYHPNYITDDNSNDVTGKEVYFRWLSRLVILCAIISLAFFLCSSLVVFRLASGFMVEPLLIVKDQSSSQDMVRYEPITTKMSSENQMLEMFIKQYVSLRNTVINDEQEMQTRWGYGGIVEYLSSPEVYRDFVGQNAGSVDKMFDNDYSSEVRIDSYSKVSENSPVWVVYFTVYNLSRSPKGRGNALLLKIIKYKASLTPEFWPERVAYYARVLNPLGFTVVQYNQDEIRE